MKQRRNTSLITLSGPVFTGLPHDAVARALAERFAARDRPDLVLVVRDQRPTAAAERRRACMEPQQQRAPSSSINR